MTALEATLDLHPLQGVAQCVEAIADALDRAPAGPIPDCDPEVLEVVVVEAARVERQLGELRLRLARAAEQSRAAELDASSGADAWLARLTGSTAAVMRGGLWLAQLLQTVLEHLSSPRRLSRNAAGEPVTDPTITDATGNFSGLSWTESMGQAFVEL